MENIIYVCLFIGTISFFNGIRILFYICSKSEKEIEVVSWADVGKKPDLNSGRWVMLSRPHKFSFYLTFTFLGSFNTKNKVKFTKSNSSYTNYISKKIKWANLSLPYKRFSEENYFVTIIYNLTIFPLNLLTNKARIK